MCADCVCCVASRRDRPVNFQYRNRLARIKAESSLMITLCVRLRNSSTVPRGCSIRPMIAAVSLLPVPGLDGVPQPYPTAVCAGGNCGPCLEAPRPGRNRAV